PRCLAKGPVGRDLGPPGGATRAGPPQPRGRRRRVRARRDDPARARRPRDGRGADGCSAPGECPEVRDSPGMIVEMHGLEVFGRHGVLEEEKLDGQTFVYDVELEVDEPAADRIDDAVD